MEIYFLFLLDDSFSPGKSRERVMFWTRDNDENKGAIRLEDKRTSIFSLMKYQNVEATQKIW